MLKNLCVQQINLLKTCATLQQQVRVSETKTGIKNSLQNKM